MRIFTSALLLAAGISAFGHDVAPPPRPDAVNPTLAPILQSFKEALLPSGRVETSYDLNGHTYKLWRQITSVVVDAPGCQARVHYDTSTDGSDPRDLATSVFFEAVDTAEAPSLQEVYNQARSRSGQPSLITYSRAVYVLSINATTSLWFPDKAKASQAAEAVNRAAQICRAAPVTPNTTAGAPGLAETLQFIADKMTDNGAVNYRSVYQNPDGSINASPPLSHPGRLTEIAADPSACIVRVNARVTQTSLTATAGTGNSVEDVLRSAQVGDNREVVLEDERESISFRRVEKLVVANVQETASSARGGAVYRVSPVIYRLDLTYLGGSGNSYRFLSEDMANRIAKAINHAVELCGGGNKDLF